jgi:hypothetical protein
MEALEHGSELLHSSLAQERGFAVEYIDDWHLKATADDKTQYTGQNTADKGLNRCTTVEPE